MFRQLKKTTRNLNKGQVVLEFTFCMIIVLLMFFGTMMVFRWTGVDLADRQRKHEEFLTFDPTPLVQVYPEFDQVEDLESVWNGYWAFGKDFQD